MADQTRLTLRAINRATLDRQFLLRRHPLSAQQAVRRLAGLQSQAPLAAYVGLWTRLAGFTTDELSGLLSERRVVRAPVMRATVHLVDREDFIAFRSLFDGLLVGVLRSNFARNLTGVDLDALASQTAELLANRPLSRAQLARELALNWPDADPTSLAYAGTMLLPVLQVPPRGIWGKTAQATWATAGSWLAAPVAPAGPQAVASLVLRYLGAFGPATVADIQTWSGLTRLREVTERLELRAYRGPDGAELLDVPDAELPAEDVPAPPRFLPEYDNLLLSHADRSRVIRHDRPVPLRPGNGANLGSVLIDGTWDADWKITAEALTITPFRRLTAAEESAITGEAKRLLAFTTGRRTDLPEVRFTRLLAASPVHGRQQHTRQNARINAKYPTVYPNPPPGRPCARACLTPRRACQRAIGHLFRVDRAIGRPGSSGVGWLGLLSHELFDRLGGGGLEVEQPRPLGGDGDDHHLLVQPADLRLEIFPGLPGQAAARRLEVAVRHAVDGLEGGAPADQEHARRRPWHVDRDRDPPVVLQRTHLRRAGNRVHQEVLAIPEVADGDHPRRPVPRRVRQVQDWFLPHQLTSDR